MMETFHSLQIASNLQLEHQVLTELHQLLVKDGDFEKAEALIRKSAEFKFFEDFAASAPYKTVWKRINATDANGETPSMRGGHQMCMDVEAGIIYMFGGWDGTKDLADFWSYNIHTDRWQMISADTLRQNGPSARSCHKICFEPKKKQIYVLGHYIDPQSRSNSPCDSDFYRFDTEYGRWIKISDNTSADGGPDLIYDHQMVVDAERQILYVFGGRIISSSPPSPENSYSGLYSYDLSSNVWRLLRADQAPTDGTAYLRSRIGHSMLLNAKSNQLYIFAGQRHKDYLSDFYIYDISTDSVIEMSRDSSKNGGPDAGFTQRATIDGELEEFYVFSGLMREKNSTTETVKNSLWVYSIRKDLWQRIYQNENMSEEYWRGMGTIEPCPRFAHQLVYDSKRKLQYLFGGNPGDSSNAALRLDDFWSLRLVKPTVAEMIRKCLFLIRKQKFREMCGLAASQDSMKALKYLQVDLAQCVDHSDDAESLAFRNLTSSLFEKQSERDVFKDRMELYESLVEFYPDSMKQPKRNLIDLI